MSRKNYWDAIQNGKGLEEISASVYDIMYNRGFATRLREIATNTDNTKHDGVEFMEKV